VHSHAATPIGMHHCLKHRPEDIRVNFSPIELAAALSKFVNPSDAARRDLTSKD